MLIEGDQEDADESSILNEDELNEILARSEEEANLFFQIDKDNARLKEKRIAEGGWTSDLITVEDLPEIYRSEEAPRQAQEEVLVGRGHRRRNNVVYDENMTEQDFIRVRSCGLQPFFSLITTILEHRWVLYRRRTWSKCSSPSSAFGVQAQQKDGGVRLRRRGNAEAPWSSSQRYQSEKEEGQGGYTITAR